jgi:hypothetical protein
MQISSRAYMGAETLVRQRIGTEHSVVLLHFSKAGPSVICWLITVLACIRASIRPWTFAGVP